MRRLAIIGLVVGGLAGIKVSGSGSVEEHWPYTNQSGADYVHVDNDMDPPFDTQAASDKFYDRAEDAGEIWNDVSFAPDMFIHRTYRFAMDEDLEAEDVGYDQTWVMDYWLSEANGGCPTLPGICWDWDGPTWIANCPSGYGCVLGTIDTDRPANDDRFWRALMRINDENAIPWHKGQGTANINDEYDLLSVMVHEFGHATGAIHMVGSELCAGVFFNTMCIDAEAFNSGQMRSLQYHEETDFQTKY